MRSVSIWVVMAVLRADREGSHEKQTALNHVCFSRSLAGCRIYRAEAQVDPRMAFLKDGCSLTLGDILESLVGSHDCGLVEGKHLDQAQLDLD